MPPLLDHAVIWNREKALSIESFTIGPGACGP
jgi:hypothetical protein